MVHSEALGSYIQGGPPKPSPRVATVLSTLQVQALCQVLPSTPTVSSDHMDLSLSLAQRQGLAQWGTQLSFAKPGPLTATWAFVTPNANDQNGIFCQQPPLKGFVSHLCSLCLWWPGTCHLALYCPPEGRPEETPLIPTPGMPPSQIPAALTGPGRGSQRSPYRT